MSGLGFLGFRAVVGSNVLGLFLRLNNRMRVALTLEGLLEHY